MTSAKHWSQDYGSEVVNRVSSQVNDIRPFEVKVYTETHKLKKTDFNWDNLLLPLYMYINMLTYI